MKLRIATMKHHITIRRAFYDKVGKRPFPKKSVPEWPRLPFNWKNYKKALNIERSYGEKGYTTTKRKIY